MVVWNLGNASDIEQFYDFQRTTQPIAEAYLKLRIKIRDTAEALRADPANAALQHQVEELKNQLQALEQVYPWLASEVAVEMALWGTTSGLL